MQHVVNSAQRHAQGFGVHYMMNPDPYRGPFGNDGAAYAAQVTLSGTAAMANGILAAPEARRAVAALNTVLTAAC